jgi:hypothetical protein
MVADGLMNDFQVFNTGTKTWSDLSKSVNGSIPSPRYGHGFTLYTTRTFMFGGLGNAGLTWVIT